MVIRNTLIFILFSFLLHAFPPSGIKQGDSNILEGSKILYASSLLDINSTTTRKNFKINHKNNITLNGQDRDVWVELNINPGSLQEPLIYINSAVLTKLNIYDDKGKIIKRLGLGWNSESTLYPYCMLKPNRKTHIFVQMQSRFIPVVASIHLSDKATFMHKIEKKKFYNTLFVGMLLITLALLLVFTYFRRKKEILYLLALGILLLYYQLANSGLMQIVRSSFFAKLDITLTSGKLNLITIFLALYVIELLKFSKDSLVLRLFKILMLIAGVEIFMAGFVNLPLIYAYIPVVLVVLGALIFMGKKLYKNGMDNLFIFLGFVLLLIHFASQFLVGLGVLKANWLQEHSLFIATLAMLMIAGNYLYRYIYNIQKESKAVMSGLDRKFLIESMVQEKQDELRALDKAKEMLKQDIHTIIEKNFRSILESLHSDNNFVDYSKVTKQLANVEQRMQAISLCYTQMLQNKELTHIQMDKVIQEIIEKIKASHVSAECNIEIATDIDAVLSVNEAVSATTTISEIVMDTYRHSCQNPQETVLLITLKQSGDSYSLALKDYTKEEFKKLGNQSVLQKLKDKLQQLRSVDAK